MTYQNYPKLLAAMRYWLQGRNYHQASEALDLALQYHTGLRKDGVTPEFQHQISQMSFCRVLEPHLLYPEETFITIALHDTPEDYDVPHQLIYDKFGTIAGKAIERMDKNRHGRQKSKEEYYGEMTDDPIASIAKGCDRMHNYQSMVDVFSLTKQVGYINEGEEFILPMMKIARKRFPQQEACYQALKHVLLSQIELIRAIHAAMPARVV
jgi:(p)ppGpp synthase/HD superfamily hydrolase